MEAFGNAKTVRNDNSSRFGKYVQIIYDSAKNRNIIGADIIKYLLEKSRVTKISKNERNFHIFYSFLTGATDDMLKLYCLSKAPADYKYLSEGLTE